MLFDGLRVIERGYGEDPRLAASLGTPVERVLPTAEPLARLEFCSYSAGLAIARGEDPAWMLDELGASPLEPDGRAIVEALFFAVAQGRASVAAAWPEFPPDLQERCERFVDEVERWTGSRWLAFVGRQTLDSMLRSFDRRRRPRTIGSWFIGSLDCAADPPAANGQPPAIAKAEFTVAVDGNEVGRVAMPICDGTIPPRLLADRVAERIPWQVLGAWFGRHVYRELEVEENDGTSRILRGGALLAEAGAAPPRGAERLDWLHEEVGWTVMLQELFRRPDWTNARFYSAAAEPVEGAAVRCSPGELIAVELGEPLPAIEWDDEPGAVGVCLGGVPLGALAVGGAPRIEPAELRIAVLAGLGMELCRAIVRELIMAPVAPASAPVGEILANAARARAEASEPGAEAGPRFVPGWEAPRAEMGAAPESTLIGMRSRGPLGTSASRYALLPAEAREEVLAGAAHAGDPVLAFESGEGPVAYLPALAWDRGESAGAEVRRLAHLEFDQLFARPDPWEYDSSPYEEQKYAETLALVPDGVERALEIGCAEGAFTAHLAERVGSVVACDFSRVALSRAAARCADRPNVGFERFDLRVDPIPDGFDLIVCSETFYVALDSKEELAPTIARLVAGCRPGTHLLCANARVRADSPSQSGFDWDEVPFGDLTIDAAIRASGWFDTVEEVGTPAYGIRLYRRRSRRRRLRPRRRRPAPLTAHGEMGAVAASLFRPEDGAPKPAGFEEPMDAVNPDLPILMYHRIAADGAAATARYRTHPDRFAAQLELLRERGYYSITFEEWRTAMSGERKPTGRPILITLDDGYADLVDHAVPLLERFGFTATFYIVADLVGGSNEWDHDLGERLPLMGWAGIRDLAARGFEIGSHSTRHRALPTLGQAELVRDLVRSKRILEEQLGQGVSSVSYPFGLYDVAVESYAGACGYTYGVTTAGRRATWGDHLLELPRLEVRGDASLDDFAALLDRRP
jgi:peptidoglycan/xylan/chitin deacetylase (PgdA/CDA1 family)